MLSDIQRLEVWLRQDQRWHDLALLGTALDSLLRSSDLLPLKVWDVQSPNGHIFRRLPQRQRKTSQAITAVLTPNTRHYLAQWIEWSGKTPEHFLFTRQKPVGAAPISRVQYAQVVKTWADWLGHAPEDFSTHSLRRTKAAHMYWEGEDIAVVSRLLGHKSLTHTVEYLGITQHQAEQAALRHEFLRGGLDDP